MSIVPPAKDPERQLRASPLASEPEPLGRRGMFGSLRLHDFRLLWLGQLFNGMAYWMDQVTRGWLMYDLTGSALQLGLVTVVQVVPLLVLSPVAGTAADRYGRKTQLIASQLLNIPPNLLLVVLIVTQHVEPWHLYVTGLLAAIVQVFQSPARNALVAESVDRTRLTNAIGLNSVAFNMSRSAGPALAGALIVVIGAGGSYLVQAMIYLVLTIWTLQLRLPNLPPITASARAEKRPSFVGSTVEGWRYLLTHETIRSAMLVAMMASLFGMSFTTLLPVFARDVLHVDAAGQGLLLTGQGIGALVSAVLIASLGDTIPKGKLMIAGVTAYGLLELAFATSQWFLVSVAIMSLIGVCHVSANALVQTVVQGHSAPAMRGRVMGAFQQNQMFTMVGGLLAGAAASVVGAPLTVAAMGITCAAGALTIYVAIPHVRNIR